MHATYCILYPFTQQLADRISHCPVEDLEPRKEWLAFSAWQGSKEVVEHVCAILVFVNFPSQRCRFLAQRHESAASAITMSFVHVCSLHFGATFDSRGVTDP
eukprot:4679776-Amphidinium_carterae.2